MSNLVFLKYLLDILEHEKISIQEPTVKKRKYLPYELPPRRRLIIIIFIFKRLSGKQNSLDSIGFLLSIAVTRLEYHSNFYLYAPGDG